MNIIYLIANDFFGRGRVRDSPLPLCFHSGPNFSMNPTVAALLKSLALMVFLMARRFNYVGNLL